MYQLLVVDDEPKVRWRVQHMVRGFDVAWDSIAADDGAQALEALDGGDANLVLADIRMPNMDGLAFLEELRARGNNALVVMLSAYTDFAYAKQAMRLGALDYLAKPLDPAELRAVLLRAGQILDLEAATSHQDTAQLQGVGDVDRDVMRSRLMADLIEGRVTSQDWRTRARVLRMAALTAQVSTVSYPLAAHEEVMEWLQEARRQVARDELPVVMIPWDRGRLSMVTCRRPPRGRDDASVATDVPSAGALYEFPPCPIAGALVGTGGVYPLEESRRSYLESLRRLQESGGGRAEESARPSHLAPPSVVSIGAHHAVKQACAWIDEHYAQPLSLGDVAREVYFHPKYLCAMFPLVTGYTFSAYLTHTRLEKAKALLLETATPCHAIAERVGYHSERCFAQAFRRRVGLTPSQYRHTRSAQWRAEDLTLSDGF